MRAKCHFDRKTNSDYCRVPGQNKKSVNLPCRSCRCRRRLVSPRVKPIRSPLCFNNNYVRSAGTGHGTGINYLRRARGINKWGTDVQRGGDDGPGFLDDSQRNVRVLPVTPRNPEFHRPPFAVEFATRAKHEMITRGSEKIKQKLQTIPGIRNVPSEGDKDVTLGKGTIPFRTGRVRPVQTSPNSLYLSGDVFCHSSGTEVFFFFIFSACKTDSERLRVGLQYGLCPASL